MHVRSCPECGESIAYSTQAYLDRAKVAGTRCKRCALEATRLKTRSQEWREAQSSRITDVWNDPNSTFNSETFHNALSDGQTNRWKNATEVKRIEWGYALSSGWTPKRRRDWIELVQSPAIIEKRRQSNIKSWENDPQRRAEQSRVASERMKDLAYKERCTRKMIEAALRTGGTSKHEIELAAILKEYGYVHGCRIGNWYVDFYNPTLDAVIEYFGDWWHCHPKHHERINAQYSGIHPNHQKPIGTVIQEDADRLLDLIEACNSVRVVWEDDVRRGDHIDLKRVISVLSLKG